MQPDRYQKYALRTWYPDDHPLYAESMHPLAGMAGEAGELLNLWKKDQYKPGVSISKSEWLDELGDLFYYLRIVAFQADLTIDDITPPLQEIEGTGDSITYLAGINRYAGELLDDYETGLLGLETDFPEYLVWINWGLLNLLRIYDCSLDELTELNWNKLKINDNHGWKDA